MIMNKNLPCDLVKWHYMLRVSKILKLIKKN